MQTTITVNLPKDDHARLRALAARMGMEPELAARFLIVGAVEGLEPEKEFIWPLFFTQANSQAVHTREIRITSA